MAVPLSCLQRMATSLCPTTETNGDGRATHSNAHHGFAGGQHPHKVVVLHHLLHGVGQRDGDRQGQALGHRHHQDGDRKDEELKGALGELAQGEALVDDDPPEQG